MRLDGRAPDQIRPLQLKLDYTMHADGSVRVDLGQTMVLCTAKVETGVPGWMRNTGKGWLTAEYSMLPGATPNRTPREATRGKQTGRTVEIQRLIGRALRSVLHLDRLGERTIWVDCDVLQADGGTRTASVTGAFVAVMEALCKLKEQQLIEQIPVSDWVSAISVGLVEERLYLDLNYHEDFQAQVDMNVIGTASGLLVEVQGTAEEKPFRRSEMEGLLDLAQKGIRQACAIQRQVLMERRGEMIEEANL